MSRKAKQFLLTTLTAVALALFGSPDRVVASCLKDYSTCVSPFECCSNRCMVQDPDDTYGYCDPLPQQE